MWIRFAAAKPERGRDVKRKQMASMRLATLQRPAIAFQHLKDSQVLRKAIAMRGVEQEKITAGPEAAVTEQVSRVSQREDRFADTERQVIRGCEPSVGLKIERITHVLKPSEFVRLQRLRRADRRFRGIAVHCVDRETVAAGQQRENRLDSFEIFAHRPPGDFDLYMRVSVIEELANLIGE